MSQNGQNIGISGHNFKRGTISDKDVIIDEDWFAESIPLLIQKDYSVLITFHGALDTSSVLEYTRNGTDYFELNKGDPVNAGQDFHETIVACDGDQINIRAKSALKIQYLIVEANYDEALLNFPLAAVSGGAGVNHNLLSATHPDTTPAAPSKGAVIRGTNLVKWEKIVGAIGQFLQIDGTGNVIWGSSPAGQSRSIFTCSHKNDFPVNLEFTNISGVEKFKNLEIGKQSVMPIAATLKNFTVSISTNTNITAFNLNLRINGLNGNGSVLIPAGITGTFQDLINTDNVVAGDLVAWQITGIGIATVGVISSSMEVLI